MENSKPSFDRTQLIGLVLIGLIFIFYVYTSSQKEAEQAAMQAEEAASQIGDTLDVASEVLVVDSNAIAIDTLEEIAREEKLYTLENNVLKLVVSDRGAQVVEAELKDYQTYDTLPLYMVKESQMMNFALGDWKSGESWFDVVENTSTSLALKTVGPNGSIVLRWALRPDEYQVDFKVSGSVTSPQPLSVDWDQFSLQHEKSLDLENQKTTISYWEIEDGDMESLSLSKDDNDASSNLRWVANKQQYFTQILTAEGRFDSASMNVAMLNQEGFSKRMHSNINIQVVNGNFEVPMYWYAGPNKYDILKEYGLEYDQLIDFGWGIFGWISRGIVVKVFNWLNGYGINYGIIILIMALMIKIVLMPLTFSSYRSMAKMRVLKPELDEINEKFKDQDPMKKQQAVMDLYREAGVNPLGGCIPQLVQLPILIAMFRFFPASIELRQQSFLWATDLSSYDSILNLPFSIPMYGAHVSLFTILMAISTFMYSYMNQQLTGTNSQMPQMKMIIYIMPFFLLFMFNSYPAGLSYYYLVANLITFGQQYAIRAFIDDKAIHAKLQANKEKPKKKSKLSQRLGQAMEASQQPQDGNRRMRRMK